MAREALVVCSFISESDPSWYCCNPLSRTRLTSMTFVLSSSISSSFSRISDRRNAFSTLKELMSLWFWNSLKCFNRYLGVLHKSKNVLPIRVDCNILSEKLLIIDKHLKIIYLHLQQVLKKYYFLYWCIESEYLKPQKIRTGRRE